MGSGPARSGRGTGHRSERGGLRDVERGLGGRVRALSDTVHCLGEQTGGLRPPLATRNYAMKRLRVTGIAATCFVAGCIVALTIERLWTSVPRAVAAPLS